MQLIVNRLVDKLEYEAKKQAPRKHIQKPVDRAAYLTGISKRTIFRMRNKQKGDASLNASRTTPKKSSKRTKKLDNFDLDIIERGVKSMFAQRKVVNLKRLRAHLLTNFGLTVPIVCEQASP